MDDFDLSTIAAIRYAKGLRPTTMRAVHFVIDTEQAEKLRQAWLPDRSVSLEFVDAPDRRLDPRRRRTGLAMRRPRPAPR